MPLANVVPVPTVLSVKLSADGLDADDVELSLLELELLPPPPPPHPVRPMTAAQATASRSLKFMIIPVKL
jgi:hypothetical protein